MFVNHAARRVRQFEDAFEPHAAGGDRHAHGAMMTGVQRVALIWLNPLRTRARQHGVMNTPLSQVGAPDPELKTSPIVDEAEYDEHAASPDLEIEAPVCYFNQEEFPLGAYVQSGAEVLQCTEHGVWVRKGEKRPG